MLGRPALAIVAAIVVVISPSPVLAAVGSASSVPAPSAPTGGVVTDAVPVPVGSSVEPLLPGVAVRLAFTLPLSNASRLASFLANVSDPASSEYRDFLSYRAVVERYGPSSGEVAAVERALRAAGGTAVSPLPGGFTVDATFDVREADALLGVHLVGYDAPRQGPGYTTVGTPRLPAALAGEIVGIDGLAGTASSSVDVASLNELSVPQPAPTDPAQFVQGNGTAGPDWFFGSDFAQAYEATELLPTGPSSVPGATYPSGIAIATLLGSGYNATNFTTLPPWSYAVVDRYFNDTFPAGWPLPTLTGVPVAEAGAPTPPPPGPFHGQGDSTDLVTENSLDLEMAGSLAPGAALYNFYVSGGLLYSPATSPSSPEYLTDDLAAALAYNYTPDHLAVISCSFGIDDLNESGWDTQLELAAAMGVTVVASSGDQGDASSGLTGRIQNAWPLWPATAAFNTSGAVSVGGVTVALSGIPTGTYTTPPLVAAYDPNVEGGLANS
ncbi:MAG TPA: protease pro-enzyme activation domain-containing protein, partial [Thermoplasmata archaeon]|nr:protease pro-enzyme activation domain-containing protein [Thermoplasmata archaeon]